MTCTFGPVVVVALVAMAMAAGALAVPSGGERRAVAVLKGASGVSGSVVLSQALAGGPVRLTGHVSGLAAGAHGFHVHALGDLRDGCVSAGPHFNPRNMKHGAPEDAARHVGDLGNIVADEAGVAAVAVEDRLLSLVPGDEHSVVGRAIVVHELQDDLGRGQAKDSLTTGAAGGRLACGVIGVI